MNTQRRKEIGNLVDQLDAIKGEIERIKEEEQEYFDNMPEGIQLSEKGEKAETAIGELENAISYLEDVVSALEETKQ